MDLRRTAVVLACTSVVVACAARVDDASQGENDVTSNNARTISPNRVAEDDDITGGESITVDDVQAFLVAKKSALATYTSGGKTAAELIVSESRKENISPLYMLVRLETEASLITSGSLRHIQSATGCGCPDTAGCDPSVASFGLQVHCAAHTMRGYFDQLENGPTVSGWFVNRPKSTSDPCAIVPENKATAALYTYTPWVGAYGIGCGTSQWGGSSLIGRLFDSFRSSFKLARPTRDASADTTTADAAVPPMVPDASTPEPDPDPPADPDPTPDATAPEEPATPDAGRTTPLPAADDSSDDPSAYQNPPLAPGKPRSGKRSTPAGAATPASEDSAAPSHQANGGCAAAPTANASWLSVGALGLVFALIRRRSRLAK